MAAWLLWARRDALRSSIGPSAWTGPAFNSARNCDAHHRRIECNSNSFASWLRSGTRWTRSWTWRIFLAQGDLHLRSYFCCSQSPCPAFIDSIISLQLQFISSELGTLFIRMFGIPVYLDGNIIDMGYYKIQVVEACSGLRYLYPLMSLGFLAAYFFKAPFWERALVFLSSIPITIILNSIRVGMVGVTVNYWGSEAADGLLHFFEGWVIFLACGGLLAFEIYFLARISGKNVFDVFYFPNVTAEPRRKRQVKSLSRLPLAISLLILCATGATGILHFQSHRNHSRSSSLRCVPGTDWAVAWTHFLTRSGNRTHAPSRRLHLVRLQEIRWQSGQSLRRILCFAERRHAAP